EKSHLWSDLLTGAVALIGVLVGGGINLVIAREAAKKELELAESRAKLEIASALVGWQLKQLAELYGPLHTLLQQSNTLYRDMNNVLAERASGKFKFEPTGDSKYLDGKLFMINIGGKWVQFRTILHLEQVYNQGYGVESYFDAMLSIGDQIVK